MTLEKILGNINRLESGCWIWTRSKSKDGYGKVWYNGKLVSTHRLIYQLFNKEIPKGMYVLHKCDNSQCVNPDHLFLGTHTDNMRDMVNKKRAATGEENGSRLTEQDVKEIKIRLRNGDKVCMIAKCFHVHTNAISDIKRKRTWKNVN